MKVRELVGSGDRIAVWMLPFVVVGVALNISFPDVFDVGGPPEWLRNVSIAVLAIGVGIWLWSAFLIVTKVPRHELITTGPYAVARHPIYTAVALLVLPWAGFLLDTWLGAALGILLYVATRIFAPAEEATLSRTFGPAWETYRRGVKLGWL